LTGSVAGIVISTSLLTQPADPFAAPRGKARAPTAKAAPARERQ
jgi:hypothetical protein